MDHNHSRNSQQQQQQRSQQHRQNPNLHHPQLPPASSPHRHQPAAVAQPPFPLAYNSAAPQQQPPQQQQQQGQQQAQQWKVPNPLGMPFAAQQQLKLQQQQQRALQQQQLQQQQHRHQQQQQRTVNSSSNGSNKPKPNLTQEAKQALQKVIYSSLRHPTGHVDPDLLQAAIATGLPKRAILHAVTVTRQREVAKRSRVSNGVTPSVNSEANTPQPAPQQQRTPTAHQQRPATTAPATQAQIQQKHEQQQKSEAKAAERALWKRVQSGIFVTQKGRFQAVPFSVGAMCRTTDTRPVVSAQPIHHPAAAALQRRLLLRQQRAPPKTGGTLLNPASYMRQKVEAKKHGKALDRTARKARQSNADALTKQSKEFHKALLSHAQDFTKFHRSRRTDAHRVAKAARDALDKQLRAVEKDVATAEKARLAALKANDMNAYSKLLEDTKNDRLRYLLDQTEGHFRHISTLLQQREGGGASDGGKNEDTAKDASSSYYSTAHAQQELVRQPSILVGGDLKEYQLTGLQWMVSLYNNKLNGILADEMGLGKTIQAISLIAYLMEFKQNLGPYLVIVPLSTLSNWGNEFAKWCPAARVVCFKGTPPQRREIYKDQVRSGHFNVLLTTYEYIIKDKKLLRKIAWQYAIVDEGHRMKNANSKFAVTLSSQYNTQFRILLTGTPLMNDLSELWSLLNFLLPSVFNSVDTFDDWFSRPFAQFSGANNNAEEGSDSLLSNEERVLIIHRLHELLRPFMLRRVKSEVLDQLPEKVEKVLRCELSSWQKMLYKQISEKAVQDGTIGANSRGLNNVVMQLRKVCNHPFLFSPEGYHVGDDLIRSSGKVALLDQMLPKLKAAGHRVLMFTQMTAVMTILEDYFAYRGYLSLRLDGSTPAEEREKRMYKFNAPDSPYFIFLLSTRAGGLGLNLTSADSVIIFDSDWNPMMDLQAQDRAHRIGQRSDVSVFRLITYSPVEEKILSRATEKLNVSELVVESGKFNKESVESDNSLERKKLMEVLLTDFDTAQPTPKADKTSDKPGSDDEDDDDGGSESSDKEDLNELLSNNENDYQLYSRIDGEREKAGKILPALYSDDGMIPDWIRNPFSGRAKASTNAFASPTEASRKRKTVAYDDGLTEKQFLRLMEKQAIEEETAKKKPRTGRSPTRPSENDDIDTKTDTFEGATGSTLLTDWTFRKLISCSKSVVALKDPATKRRLSEVFMEKPDPATFPDYYEIVDKPIAINDILRKCRAKMYGNVSEFRDDWKLMFANALKFNGEGSWVVVDAAALEKELERVLKKNGFTDDQKPPTSKKSKKLRIKLSLKDLSRE